MDTNAKRYLELISQHLQEHHAALFVGAGFSLNADKVTLMFQTFHCGLG